MKSLEEYMREWESPAKMVQNSPWGMGFEFPVQRQWTNIIDELQSWRKTAVMFDQSFHMMELYIKGADINLLLSSLAINDFRNFGKDKAKQITCVNENGYLISDAIVFGLEDDLAVIVGRPPVCNWVNFHITRGGWDVTCWQDLPGWEDKSKPRTHFRFQIIGPRALDILNDVNEGAELTTKFFGMGYMTIAGVGCRTLCHSMSGSKGLEIFGPMGHKPEVEEALVKAGEKHGMKRGGARAYGPTAGESGWFAAPLPAIYTGEAMKPYREWLPMYSMEGLNSVGGSFEPEDVSDYYLTPFELEYDRLINYDREFVGRDALLAMKDRPHRKKVIYRWSKEGVLQCFAGMIEGGTMPQFLDIASSELGWQHYDRVEVEGRLVGISGYPLYSANERAWLSVGIVDPEFSTPGTEATLIWGEANGGTKKPSIHEHRQIEIGVEICPWPIDTDTRSTYRAQK
ncbi:aminomethyl transferase family protein [Mesorhizobium sp. Cs1299R1N3]|uniref:aminomethyl transferase family protein n=1 Tax=Mesorhizobium sp. Cs1299R1N3 TaxID=3015173 RepID=UPI00301D1745